MQNLKSNPSVTYRPSVKEDIVDFYGCVPVTMRSISFFLDGELAAIGGYKVQDGVVVIFSDIKEWAKTHKQSVWRCAKIVREFVKKTDAIIYAVAENCDFVSKLGFCKVGGDEEQDLYRMEKD